MAWRVCLSERKYFEKVLEYLAHLEEDEEMEQLSLIREQFGQNFSFISFYLPDCTLANLGCFA